MGNRVELTCEKQYRFSEKKLGSAHRFTSFLREWSLLILGTRAEDNFAQLEKISYPILNIEIVFIPHHLSAKCFRTPFRSLCAKNRSMERYQVVPSDFHTVQVIYHFQVSVNFASNL